MRHAKKSKKLSLTSAERKALLRSLSVALLKNQRIKTTFKKAKLAQPFIEKIITLSRIDNLTNRRRAFAILNDHAFVKFLFESLGPLFKNRNGGYTRIMRMGFRRGDNALMALFELTEKLPEKTAKIKEKKAKKADLEAKAEAKEVKEQKKAVEKKTPKVKKEKTESVDKKQPPLEKPQPEGKKDKEEEKKTGQQEKTFLKGLRKFFKREDQK